MVKLKSKYNQMILFINQQFNIIFIGINFLIVIGILNIFSNRHPRQSWRTKTQQNSPSSGIGHSPSEATKSSSPEREKMALNERREKVESEFWAPPNLPMKKVIRKSRWVSIHDGKPMSQFVETVHYEPAYGTATAGSG